MEWIKYLYKQIISTPLVRTLKALHVTANQLTVFNHVMTLTIGVWGFSRGTWSGNLIGLGVMAVNVILDYADGDLARATKKYNPIGEWIDSAFDVVIQNAIMASILIGCIKTGLNPVTAMAFMVGNTASNMVSFHYNQSFGFHSAVGSSQFRFFMLKKPRPFNRIMLNLVDPTSSAVGLVLYTVRYWVLVGALLNVMPLCVYFITLVVNVRWLIMYVLYAWYLEGKRNLYVLKVFEYLGEKNAI